VDADETFHHHGREAAQRRKEDPVPLFNRDGVNLYYETHGDGSPVVLTPGFSGTTRMWKPQIAPLSAASRLILWDKRGHGQSDSPDAPEDYSQEIVVDDLAALLDHLGVQRAVIGGLSLGGYTAMRFFAKYPSRTRALILADTGPGYRNPDRMKEWTDGRAQVADMLEQKGLEGYFSSQEGDLGYTSATDIPHRSATGLANVARYVMKDPPLVPAESITVPSLVIVGERDTPFLAASEYMASRIPGARYALIPNAGHAANLDNPEAFNKAVLDFLAELGDEA
jgi:pimeloyl-ACP methyl ester carboxylesterase